MTQPSPQPIRASVTDLIQTTAETDEARFSVLYVGQPGTLKTTYALSWPDPMFEYWDPNDATLKKVPGVKYIMHPTIREHETQILPAIQNRELDCGTIVIDSFSFLADAYIKELKGTKDKLDIAQWGTLLDRLDRTCKIILGAKQPKGNHPGYHIVATCHERDVYDSDGNLVRISPAIDGQFKDRIARYFDAVFITAMEMERVQRDDKWVKEPAYFILTGPTDKYRVALDRIGGGRRKRLPLRMEGTYPALCEAWGIDQ
jgi:hypothetical protein